MGLILNKPLVPRLAVGVIFGLLLGCSGAEPKIQQLYWELEYQRQPYRRMAEGPWEKRDKPLTRENLSVYLQPEDSDGFEDLRILYILHDDSETYWEAGTDEWILFEEEGLPWIGMPQIQRADPRTAKPLPRGKYRVELRDRAGRTAAASFRLIQRADPTPEEIPFPRLVPQQDSSRFQLEVQGDRASVWIYSRGEELISRKTFNRGGVYRREELFAQPSQAGRGAYALVYGGDPRREAGLLWGPVPLE